ncbi:DUF4212 domain-containing protein [Pontiellaceae bacterium B12219]|nr:DUF4212 domain-containing protein [Pontiellaceae bacterium B12219]
MDPKNAEHYHRASLRVVFSLLTIWFMISFGCGILFRDWLDANFPTIGTAPFGFWMAQQGSIFCFVVLLIVYALLMGRLDSTYGYNEEKEPTQ